MRSTAATRRTVETEAKNLHQANSGFMTLMINYQNQTHVTHKATIENFEPIRFQSRNCELFLVVVKCIVPGHFAKVLAHQRY